MMQPDWLSSLLHDLPGDALVIDGVDLRCLHASPSAYRNLHYSADELGTLTLPDLIAGVSRSALDAMLAALREGQSGVMRFDARHVCKDGSTYPASFQIRYCTAALQPAFQVVSTGMDANASSGSFLGRAFDNAAREDERLRIARELHDELGGNLVAIKMALRMLDNACRAEEPAVRNRTRQIDALVDSTIDAMHRIAEGLRLPPREDGVVAALERQAREFERHSGIACRFVSKADEVFLGSDQAVAVIYIVKEALTNVGKHARAMHVDITLSVSAGLLTLEISDDGNGMSAPRAGTRRALGLLGMNERAAELHGSLQISTAPGRGCVVRLAFPLPPPDRPTLFPN